MKTLGFAYLFGLLVAIFYKQHFPSLHTFYVILNIGFVALLGVIILAGGIYNIANVPKRDDRRWHEHTKSKMAVDMDIREVNRRISIASERE